MSDAFTFPVLAVSALTQAFGFLYGRAGAVLDRRATRREGTAAGELDAVPAVVVGIPGPPAFDAAALTPERVQRIESLLEVLGVYDDHRDLIRADDERLRRSLGGLRAVLEEVEGQRLTFTGENRPASGVRIEQVLDDVHGRAAALKVRRVAASADVSVRQRAGTVHEGAEIVGAEIDEIS
ncbi:MULTISPECIES: hypothetical protein [unclassified Streptomyces]|uniref:hypothetical protein n=1 Tax=unclassified Streptomyces TaxID=2593676 RepID=UPI00131D2C32|nr:hypothetical protein [Streptomyces sp. NRRL WC-3549]